jgi:rare lipoprotein A
MCSPIAARRPVGRRTAAIGFAAAALALAGCAGGRAPSPPSMASSGRTPAYNRPYQVRGRWYAPHAQPGYDVVGVASWYSYEAPSRRTADGEPFDIGVPSAAHTTLPIPSWLEVTNLDNGRRARVRLNDRGPFAAGRLLDVSRAAAVELGFVQQGTARVRVRWLGPATPLGGGVMWTASASPPPRSEAPQRYTEAEGAPPAPDLRAPDPREEVAEDAAASTDDVSTPVTSGAGSPGARFEVQAAAFADRGNAERAAARLAAAGRPRIEPLRRGETVLYRVLVGGWPLEEDAATARTQAVALGFPDARVIAR